MKRFLVLMIGLLMVAAADLSAGPTWFAPTVVAASGRNVYVVWKPSPLQNIRILRSLDGGATWKPAQDLGEAYDLYSSAVAASGSNVYVAGAQSFVIHLLRSKDGGATWDHPVNWPVPRPANVSVVASGERVDLIWLERDYEIHYSSSKDSGASWTVPDHLSLPSAPDGRGILAPSLEADTLAVAWFEPPRGTGFFRQTLSDTFLYVEPRPPVARYMATSDTGEFLSGLAWSETDGDGSNSIVAMRLRETGDGWLPVVKVSSSDGYNNAPVLKHSGNTLYALWLCNKDGKNGVRTAHSLNGGATWLPDRSISQGAPLICLPMMAAAGSNVYAFWWTWIEGASPEREDLVFRRSTDRGATWKREKRLFSVTEE